MPAVRAPFRSAQSALVAGAVVAALVAPAAARADASRPHPSLAGSAFDNWAQFRFNAGHAGVNPLADGLTARTASRLKQRWSFGTVNADFVQSSPAVQGSTVYCGADDGYLYALNTANGKRRWRFFVSSKGVTSSPAVAKGIVYVGSPVSTPGLLALSAGTGAIKWTFNTGAAVAASPSIQAGIVYFTGTGGDAYALKASNGKKLWSFAAKTALYSSPAVADGMVYFGGNNGKIYALSEATGKLKWTYRIGGSVISSPTVAAGVVYATSSNLADKSNVVALKATTGKRLWNFEPFFGTDGFSSPAVSGGLVYVGANDARVYALATATGKIKWSYTSGGSVQSSPAVAGGVVYVGSQDGYLYALNASTGKRLWRFHSGIGVYSSPAVSDGVVYVGSDLGKIYAFARGR